jgi:hypothetical protein
MGSRDTTMAGDLAADITEAVLMAVADTAGIKRWTRFVNERIQRGNESPVPADWFDLSLVTSTPASLLHERSGRRFPAISAPRARADGGLFSSPSGFTNYLHLLACKPGCQAEYFYRSMLKRQYNYDL